MTDNLRDAAQAVLDRWDSLDWKAAPTADYMNRLRAALAAAPQPDDEWLVIPDTPEERAYRKGWNEAMTAGHKLVPVDDPSAPQPAPEQGMTRAEVGQMLDAKRHDREALVEAINQAQVTWNPDATSSTQHIADALLARGLRLPGPETMAWAVVGEDGKVVPASCGFDKEYVAGRVAHPWDRIVPVAIRVVEGGDNAA